MAAQLVVEVVEVVEVVKAMTSINRVTTKYKVQSTKYDDASTIITISSTEFSLLSYLIHNHIL